MDWLKELNEPFFRTQQDAEKYIDRELPPALPDGWGIRQPQDEELTWVIQKEKLDPKEWPLQDYCVRVSKGLDLLIFTCGNTDVGPFGLHHALQTALVMQAVMLRKFDLGECLRFLVNRQKPNEWGYT